METLLDKVLEVKKMDTDHRAFGQFIIKYQTILESAEDYLDGVIEKTAPAYAEAYKPWGNALHELLTGTYLISRKIPLPDVAAFMETLRMFSFDSTIKFLCDICKLCGIQLHENWEKEFREHIDKLLFAIANLSRQQQCRPAR